MGISPLPGTLAVIWKTFMPRPGRHRDGEELHLLAVAGSGAGELNDRLAADLRDGRLCGLAASGAGWDCGCSRREWR